MSGFCPEHGPYDGVACPYHGGDVGGRPENPSLNDDLPTEPPGGFGRPGYDNGEAPTEMPGGGGPMYDDEEPTEYPFGGYDDIDVTELDKPETIALALLWVKEGRRRGRTYPITHGTIVGRKEGGLILDDPKVSGTHAKFTMEKNDFIVWDFGSSNGTYVNGKKIREATVLEENDLVKIGETVFVVKLLEPRPKRRKPASRRKTTTKKNSSKSED